MTFVDSPVVSEKGLDNALSFLVGQAIDFRGLRYLK